MITLRNGTKTYDNGQDLGMKDVNLSVKDGEFLCVIGPSGCGKSTLLKTIAGLEELTSGTISYVDPSSPVSKSASSRVSMVFQNGALFPWLTVTENVAVGLESSGVPHAHAIVRAGQYIRLMKLEEHAHKFGRDLSGGQRQRVGIARALAAETNILLLDEPFSALDPKTTFELHQDLLDIWQKTKKTIIMVSHSIEEAVTLAQKIAVMREGTIEKTVDVTIPYPREDTSLPFLHLVRELRQTFFR